jgi:hypothetical protein
MIKSLVQNKTLLGAYAIIQLSTLFLRTPVALFAYELCYVAAIVVGAIWTVGKTKDDRNLKTLVSTSWRNSFTPSEVRLRILRTHLLLIRRSLTGS